MASNELTADKAMFEAAARGNLYACYSFSPFGGGQISDPPRTYLDTKTEAAWQLWQLSAARPTPAQGGLSDAEIVTLRNEVGERYNSVAHASDSGICEFARALISRIRGQQGGGDAADRVRLNWIENQSDFGPIEITLGKGTRPNTTATYLTYGADDGGRISSGPARNVRAAIDQCKDPDAAIQAQAGEGEKA